MQHPSIVSPEVWEAERDRLLVKEKAATKARDALAAERRRLPWVRIDKEYSFEGPEGRVGLRDIFAGRRQLIIYRFFYAPDVEGWPEKGCTGCSMFADNVGHLAHLHARDTSFALASTAPQDMIAQLQQRMGWDFPWYTTRDDFSRDFGVEEYFGLNVFIREGDDIFRTYFTNNRAGEAIGSVWSLLDITPLGRQEEWEDSPPGYPQTPPYTWWRRHNEYDA